MQHYDTSNLDSLLTSVLEASTMDIYTPATDPASPPQWEVHSIYLPSWWESSAITFSVGVSKFNVAQEDHVADENSTLSVEVSQFNVEQEDNVANGQYPIQQTLQQHR
jgi:hypothetical protein